MFGSCGVVSTVGYVANHQVQIMAFFAVNQAVFGFVLAKLYLT
jgi:hypothetical protein